MITYSGALAGPVLGSTGQMRAGNRVDMISLIRWCHSIKSHSKNGPGKQLAPDSKAMTVQPQRERSMGPGQEPPKNNSSARILRSSRRYSAVGRIALLRFISA